MSDKRDEQKLQANSKNGILNQLIWKLSQLELTN